MKYILVIILLAITQFTWASNNVVETERYLISYSPQMPTFSDEVFIKITNKDPCVISRRNATEVVTGVDGDLSSAFSRINFYVYDSDFEDSRDNDGNCLLSDLTEETFSLGSGFAVENWSSISVFTQGYFPDENQEAEAIFNVSFPYNSQLNTEVPAMGSIQSGVGLIRGWACDARNVEIAFDDGERIPVAYGTSRKDTVGKCGDDNNGYGMVFAWGLLGKGTHQMKTFIDDNEVSDVSFEVAGLDDAFITGLSGTYELDDFPAPGESVTVEWSESDQNFIIIDKQ